MKEKNKRKLKERKIPWILKSLLIRPWIFFNRSLYVPKSLVFNVLITTAVWYIDCFCILWTGTSCDVLLFQGLKVQDTSAAGFPLKATVRSTRSPILNPLSDVFKKRKKIGVPTCTCRIKTHSQWNRYLIIYMKRYKILMIQLCNVIFTILHLINFMGFFIQN